MYLLFIVIIAIFSTISFALPIGSCTPSSCPSGYRDEGTTCTNGICTRTCSTTVCNTSSGTEIFSTSLNLNDEDVTDLGIAGFGFGIGSYTATNTSKCYRFRQTTPSAFISGSRNTGYDSTANFDSGIAIFWRTDSSKWYDSQSSFCTGDGSEFLTSSTGGTWIDSCDDNGDDVDSADSFINTNSMYCAPDQNACGKFNSNCDTDCYDHSTSLRMDVEADLANTFDCNAFSGDTGFCNVGSGNDPGSPVIDDVNFASTTVTMYVDEYNTTNTSYTNQQCQYWPQCNPADPCCDSGGYFRANGYACKNAHNAQCTSATSAGCSGVAYEDRCTGNISTCPDNNFQITYAKACDQVACVNQSCSGSSFQSQRACDAGTCQRNDAFNCPYNLKCENSVSCKKDASSSSDCRTGYTYDSVTDVCWLDSGDLAAYDLFYDENGNLISALGLNYTYNAFNQLINLKNSNNGNLIEEYTYDHNGNRKRKIIYNNDGSNTTIYYVNDNFVQIVNSSGIFNETYYYLYDKIVGKKDTSGNTLFFHPDHLGSTRLITNINGNTVADLSYEPYGELIDGSNERFLYEAKELDSTDLYYFGARYQDPSNLIGFTQPDMIIQNIYDPQSLNRYSFERNNPYKYVDSSGNYFETAIDIGFIAYDINEIRQDPSLTNYLALGADVGGALLPFATGLGLGVRGVSKVDDVGKVLLRADNIRGLSRIELESIAKIDNIKNLQLTDQTLQAARKELRGEIVARKATGIPYDHIKKVQNAQRGLAKQIETLKKSLNNPQLNQQARNDIQNKLVEASKLLDKSERYVPRGGS